MTQDYTLAHGTHTTPRDGRCAMEWVSHLAGEPHSDAPGCVSPVLRAICIALNDGLQDGPRQRLRPFLTRTIGTAHDGLDPERSWLALDWLIRSYTPSWLALIGLDGSAQTLSAATAVTGRAQLAAVIGELVKARRAVRTARRRSYGSSWVSAVADQVRGRQVGDRKPHASHSDLNPHASHRDLGRAGRAVSWGGAGAAAWAAARIAIEDPAAERARRLMLSVAGDAAAIAVRRVPPDVVCGRPAPLDAARTALGRTLDDLNDSALVLLGRMLPTITIDLGAGLPTAPEVAVTRMRIATSYLVDGRQVGDRQVGDRDPQAGQSDLNPQAGHSDLEHAGAIR